jgi:glycosyltransferase involved in cell wall biosynthesis
MSGLVKVIVPCYGYGELLRGCVTSILGQEKVRLKVLIVDDCSPDDTSVVGRELQREDARVEYRRHERNKGLIATANEGLEWAVDSDFVALISADDLLVPGSLSRATSVMERHPTVGMVYGRAPYFNPDSPLPSTGGQWRGTKIWPGRSWIRLRCRSGYNCISSPEVLVRTEVQRRAGGYDPVCRHASDLNMWLRIAAISDVGYIHGAAQAMYRVHPASMLRSAMSKEDGTMTDLVERRTAFDRALVDDPSPWARRQRAKVHRALARQALWRASRAYDRNLLEGAGATQVDELIGFALGTCPDARRLPEWWGLRLRRRIGAGRSLWFLPFLLTGAGHRLLGHARKLRWRVQGV